MNRKLQLFRLADATSATLCGGQAPRLWRRECARGAARLGALARVAGWGAQVYRRAPGLNETPLWGECLAELAARAPARIADEVAHSRTAEARHASGTSTHARARRTPDDLHPPRRKALSPSQEHDPQTRLRQPYGSERDAPFDTRRAAAFDARRTAALDAQPRSQTPAAHIGLNSSEAHTPDKSVAAFVPEVERLPRAASQELLRRFAGRHSPSPVAAQKNSRPAQRSTGEQPSTRPHTWPDGGQWPHAPRQAAALIHASDAAQPRSIRARLPDISTQARAHQWRGLLAARTALSLRRAVVDFPLAPALMEETLIAHQLSSFVSSETAPHELLARFADRRASVSGAHRPPGVEPRAAQSSPPPVSHVETGRDVRIPGAAATRGGAPVSPVHFRGIEVEAQQARGAFAEANQPGEVSAPVPPASLPPLLPPPLVGMSVLPIALSTARAGARVEAQETEEDLDALAAKIKLILDEQARRHGLDV